MGVCRWCGREKVGRLRERRRRLKASRIVPGTVPKYRTELARPQRCVRLATSRLGHEPRSPDFSEPIYRTHHRLCTNDSLWIRRGQLVQPAESNRASYRRINEGPLSRAPSPLGFHLLTEPSHSSSLSRSLRSGKFFRVVNLLLLFLLLFFLRRLRTKMTVTI